MKKAATDPSPNLKFYNVTLKTCSGVTDDGSQQEYEFMYEEELEIPNSIKYLKDASAEDINGMLAEHGIFKVEETHHDEL